ncbi:reverse transcriptase domain-containing protein [Tanacetum coccineum]
MPQTFANNGVPSYNGSMYPAVTPLSNYPFYTQPMYAPPNMPMYPNPTGSFTDSTGFVTPFIRWIKDYPLSDGQKMPSHIGSYDGKGDPDNFLLLFKGAIRMQKWLMPVACHMFTYTLKDSACIWWNSQKTGSILNYEDLKAKFWSHFNQQKKFTKTHLAVHNIKQRESESTRAFIARYTDDTLQILGLHEEQRISGFVHAREVATNGTPNDRRENFERLRKSSWDNNSGQKGKDRFSPYRGPNHGLLSNLSKSPREILSTEKATRSFEQPPRMFGSRQSRDMSKYCHFHEDYGHVTNDCCQLRNQIEEAVKSGQLSYLVKGIKKEKVKASENQRTEGKKDKSTSPAEAPMLMIRQDESYTKNKFEGLTSESKEITFPLGGSNSSAPVVIKAKVFGREVNRVHMDSRSSCEVIYQHCFMKLKPSIISSKVDSKVPLIGFLGEKSWSIGKIPQEITIGDPPLTRKETLNFMIVKSD